MKGTYRGGVDRRKARGRGLFIVEEGKYAGYRFEGEWEDNVMRRGELKTEDGTRYVGEFSDDGRFFRGRGELWLRDGIRHFDGEWEEHYGRGFARRGMAVDSDGAVYRVEFEGGWGAYWKKMELAFDEKQRRHGICCAGSSWTRLPVRTHTARDGTRACHGGDFAGDRCGLCDRWSAVGRRSELRGA
jgi:hypothetical protein